MIPRRLLPWLLCAALATAVGLVVVWRGGLEEGSERSLRPGEAYAAKTVDDRCQLDLKFERDGRYVLVVSSLGRGRQTHRVRLTSTRSPQDPAPPLSLLKPLAPANKPAPIARVAAAARPTPASAPRSAADRTNRVFYIHVTDGSLENPAHYARIEGRLAAEGESLRVYLDGAQSSRELAPGILDEIVRLFDREIIPRVGAQFGGSQDVDGDGKFTVLLSSWLGRLEGGKTSLGGFVRSADFRREFSPPVSNRCDMMYLNSNVRPGRHLKALLAHEYTHAVCFSQRLASDVGGNLPDEQDWLNEAIAHVAENMLDCGWTNLDYRISRFLNEPQKYPLVIGDYYRAGLWRDHGCRGATYLFLNWCVGQFGEGLVGRLVQGPLPGKRNLERATGLKFDELYRRWSIATWQSGRNASHDAGIGAAELDLREPLAEWGLAGPRPVLWNVDEPAPAIELKGTATAYVELRADGAADRRQIGVEADPGARLQVSVLRIPSDWPRVDVRARWAAIESSEPADSTDRPAPSAVQLLVKAPRGCRVETIACERNSADVRWSSCTTGDKLPKRLLWESTIGAGSAERCYEIPVRTRSDLPLVVKVVACDERGRRTSAWATLRASDLEPPRLADADSGSKEGRRR